MNNKFNIDIPKKKGWIIKSWECRSLYMQVS